MNRSSRPIVLSIGLILVFMVGLAFQGVGDQPGAHTSTDVTPDAPDRPNREDTESAESTVQSVTPQRVGYVVSRDGTVLKPASNHERETVAPGVVFAVTGEDDDGYRVLGPCNRESWLEPGQVEMGLVPSRAVRTFDSAVFVIDPGHGLPDLGAVGASGLTETEVNSDVSARIVELLQASQDIDWDTGEVTPGSNVPAAAAAVMTRPIDGPNGGDYEVGLTFRAELANSISATALVSIHHNSGSETNLNQPGSEAYVSANDPESARLGGLVVEELRKGLQVFDAAWVGATGTGVASRVDQGGLDYYTVLKVSEAPAVIAEGAYISNPSEEALARTDEFRQAYAESIYRALVRFVTTEDNPIPAPEPELWVVDGPARSMDDCHVPTP